MGSKSLNQGTEKNDGKKYVSQAEVPRYALEDALKVAKALYDDFGGRNASAAPHQLAIATDISPTSTNWKFITGASIAYGLTNGGYNAQSISLAELGRRILSPTEEGDENKAKAEAVLKPQVLRKFFDKYNRSKFPQDNIAKNILEEMGVPTNRLDELLNIIKKNGRFAGIIHDTKTGPFVAIESGTIQSTKKVEEAEIFRYEESPSSLPPTVQQPSMTEKNIRVFISHGKNKAIVQQIKELITYGKLTPIVAEEQETTSKPVPEKVLAEMRSCFAGVIHIEAEELLLDEKGDKKPQLNDNVLIEIGAALALYGNNIILLVKKGISLPSNLQGLYLCNYEGDKLDYDSTMKLLKTLSQFS